MTCRATGIHVLQGKTQIWQNGVTTARRPVLAGYLSGSAGTQYPVHPSLSSRSPAPYTGQLVVPYTRPDLFFFPPSYQQNAHSLNPSMPKSRSFFFFFFFPVYYWKPPLSWTRKSKSVYPLHAEGWYISVNTWTMVADWDLHLLCDNLHPRVQQTAWRRSTEKSRAARDVILAPAARCAPQCLPQRIPQSIPRPPLPPMLRKKMLEKPQWNANVAGLKRKWKSEGLQQETAWGRGEEPECLSLKCKEQICLLRGSRNLLRGLFKGARE